MRTPIYHPTWVANKKICTFQLGGEWHPATTLQKIAIHIYKEFTSTEKLYNFKIKPKMTF